MAQHVTESEVELHAGSGTVGKACLLLERVAAHARPVRFSTLRAETGFPNATLHRLLRTLAAEGMIAYDPHRQGYGLGLGLMRLAHAAWARFSLAAVAREALDALSERTGETIHLAQLDRGQVLYVDKREARLPVAMFSGVGMVGPAYCTGVGKAMLAFLDAGARAAALAEQSFRPCTAATHCGPGSLEAELDEIRAEGVAFDREEHEAGITCIAAPVLAGERGAIGAVSITMTTARGGLEALAAHRPALCEAARQIGEAAVAWSAPA